MRTATAISFTILVIAGATILLLGTPDDTNDSPQRVEGRAASASSREDLDHRDEVPGRRQGSQSPIPSEPVANGPVAAAEVPQLSPTEAWNAVVESLRKPFESEPVDPEWAAEAEAQLASYIVQQPGLTQFDLPKVSCRSTRCKVELTDYGGDEIAEADWYKYLRAGVGDWPWKEYWGTTAFSAEVENGVTKVSWFFVDLGPFVTSEVRDRPPGMQFVILTDVYSNE